MTYRIEIINRTPWTPYKIFPWLKWRYVQPNTIVRGIPMPTVNPQLERRWIWADKKDPEIAWDKTDFPIGSVWRSYKSGEHYVLLNLGSVQPSGVSPQFAVTRNYANEDYSHNYFLIQLNDLAQNYERVVYKIERVKR